MVRVTQHLKSTPREALNWRIFTAIAVIGLAGLSRGGVSSEDERDTRRRLLAPSRC